MIPKHEDLEYIHNISEELAYRFAVLYDKIVALEIQNEQLRKELTERIHMCDMRSEKILELTAERDEARRLFCKCHVHSEAVRYAESRGWDCFKEAK